MESLPRGHPLSWTANRFRSSSLQAFRRGPQPQVYASNRSMSAMLLNRPLSLTPAHILVRAVFNHSLHTSEHAQSVAKSAGSYGCSLLGMDGMRAAIVSMIWRCNSAGRYGKVSVGQEVMEFFGCPHTTGDRGGCKGDLLALHGGSGWSGGDMGLMMIAMGGSLWVGIFAVNLEV